MCRNPPVQPAPHYDAPSDGDGLARRGECRRAGGSPPRGGADRSCFLQCAVGGVARNAASATKAWPLTHSSIVEGVPARAHTRNTIEAWARKVARVAMAVARGDRKTSRCIGVALPTAAGIEDYVAECREGFDKFLALKRTELCNERQSELQAAVKKSLCNKRQTT